MRKNHDKYDERTKYYLDNKDISILEEIMKNARASVAGIAERTNMLRDTVRYRLKKMEDSYLIYDYHTILNPKVLGYEFFSHVFIKTEPVGKESLSEFYKKLENMPNVTHISTTFGAYDLVLTIAAKDAEDFARVINEMKSSEKKIITSLEVATIIDDLKLDDFSGLISKK